ncbi:MAG: hypothetical protein ABSG94_08650 [Brevinematales bacterium]|jgi:hypothetical protein
MNKKWKVAAALLIVCFIKGYSYQITEYPHKSKYDQGYMNVSDTNMLISSLDDKDLEVEFSALKRIGILKISAAKPKVEEIVGESNPEVNQGKALQRAEYKYLFDMGVLVLGKIGDDGDAVTLSKLLREVKDDVSLICVLQALGDLSDSKVALEYMHQYAALIDNYSDGRVVKALVDSITAHRSRTSVHVLLLLIDKAPQNLRDYINDAVKELEKEPVEKADTNKAK